VVREEERVKVLEVLEVQERRRRREIGRRVALGMILVSFLLLLGERVGLICTALKELLALNPDSPRKVEIGKVDAGKVEAGSEIKTKVVGNVDAASLVKTKPATPKSENVGEFKHRLGLCKILMLKMGHRYQETWF